MSNVNRNPTSPIPQENNPVQGYAPSTLNRLLVVDDNEDIHMVLRDRLKAMGYVVLRANNGAEALEVLAMVSVVGVLLDLERPVMDGLTFLREL